MSNIFRKKLSNFNSSLETISNFFMETMSNLLRKISRIANGSWKQSNCFEKKNLELLFVFGSKSNISRKKSSLILIRLSKQRPIFFYSNLLRKISRFANGSWKQCPIVLKKKNTICFRKQVQYFQEKAPL
jgi:hypothetical protein